MSTAVIVIVALVLLAALWWVVTRNAFIRARNKCDEAWSGVDVQLGRRHDLVPNLVATVKGYAEHESGVLARVAANAQAYNTRIQVFPASIVAGRRFHPREYFEIADPAERATPEVSFAQPSPA